MQKERLQYLISNLLNNDLLTPEKKELTEWLDSADADDDCMAAWDDAGYEIDDFIKEEMWGGIKNRIVTEKALQKSIRLPRLYSVLKVAAMIAVILCCGITAYFIPGNKTCHSSSGQLYSFSVEPGQKASMRLADGTIVWLNSASRITFDEDYNINERIVNLDGEAFFDVAKNPEKKFIVKCNGMEVEALGTEFNVKAYSNDSVITTTLAKGKVKVSSCDQNLTLLPNDVATYNLKRQTIEGSKVDDIAVADYWRSGQLVFDGEPLASIAQTIERMYNVKVNLKSEQLKNLKFTGTIQNNSLTNIIHIISLSYPLTYTISDSVITLSN